MSNVADWFYTVTPPPDGNKRGILGNASRQSRVKWAALIEQTTEFNTHRHTAANNGVLSVCTLANINHKQQIVVKKTKKLCHRQVT